MKIAPRIPGASQLTAGAARFDPFLSAALWIAILVAVVAAALGTSAIASSPAFPLIVGVLVISVIAFALIVGAHHNGHDACSPLGLICLFYVATFAIGAVYFYVSPWPGGLQPFEQDDLAPAVGLGAIGLVMLTIGYWANPLRSLLRVIPALPRDVTSRTTFALVASLLVVGWVARAHAFATGNYFYSDSEAGPTTGSSWLILTSTNLPLLVTAYCGARYYFARRAGASYGNVRWQYYLLLAVEVAYVAPTARRTAILSILMMVLVLRYYGLRRRPTVVSVLATVTFAVIVVFPIVNTFRNTQTPFQENLTGNFLVAAQSLRDSSPSEAIDSGLDSTFQRFSGVTSMAAILHYGPDASQRKPGETLAWSLTALLPRAVAPNKPNPGSYGNEFAQTFAVAAPGPATTSVAVPHVAELYLSYRVAGIILGMFIIGSVYRLLGDYLIGRKTDPLTLAVYATLAWVLVNSQEAIVAGSVLGIFKLATVLVIALLAASRLQHVWAKPR